jgi:hypothetical protein
VREAEELEDFRPSLPAFTTPFFGKRPEPEVSCLVGMQLESETLEALAQVGTKPGASTSCWKPSTRSSVYRTTIISPRAPA